MEKLKILYISQEITPFLDETEISTMARTLPQKMHEAGNEIRVFMPRYGCINERRHQLHEVIRLSGMNLVINDEDHPLIIKVASIPQARMQVYFIDNEEFFRRKAVLTDDKGKHFDDNDERSLFFCKGALETVKKLGWKPDVVHCHGWMTAMVPMLIKKMFNEDPHFENAKLVYSVYKEAFPKSLDKKLVEKLAYDQIDGADVELLKNPTANAVHGIALQYADAVVKGSPSLAKDTDALIASSDLPVLDYQGAEGYEKAYAEFYQQVFSEESALV
jgi:starch synthase